LDIFSVSVVNNWSPPRKPKRQASVRSFIKVGPESLYVYEEQCDSRTHKKKKVYISKESTM
jgi:hypothetical protein